MRHSSHRFLAALAALVIWLPLAHARPSFSSTSSELWLTASTTATFKYSLYASTYPESEPVTYSATGLPPGLALDPSVNAVTGTPTTAGDYVSTITASDSVGSATLTLTFHIEPADAAPVIYSPDTAEWSMPGYYVGTPFWDYLIQATGAPTSFDATGVPGQYASVNRRTGEISDDFMAPGVYKITLSATNQYGTGTKVLTLNVPVQAKTFYNDTGKFAPGDRFVIAIGYNGVVNVSGTPSVDVSVGSAPRQAAYLSGSGTSTLLFAYTFQPSDPAGAVYPGYSPRGGTLTDANGLTVVHDLYMKYYNPQATFDPTLPAGGPFALMNGTLESVPAGTTVYRQLNTTGWPTQISAAGLPPGLSLTVNADSVTHKVTGVVTGKPTTPGEYTAKVTMSDGVASSEGALSFRIDSDVPALGGTAVGQPFQYDAKLVLPLGPYSSYSAAGLPPGLAIDSRGIISGTPTAAGTYTATITGYNTDAMQGTFALKITIDATGAGGTPTPTISSPATASVVAGTAFTFPITASNAPTSFSATGLPPGLAVSASTGVISGAPTAPGSYQVTLGATNAGGTATSVLTLTVTAAPTPVAAPVITSSVTASAVAGAAFSYTIQASNTPTRFSATGLPAGVGLNSATGVISGTPTTSGTYTVTLGATNDGGTGTATLTVAVADASTPVTVPPTTTPSPSTTPTPATQTITFGAVGAAVVGEAMPLQATASSGLAVTFSVVTGDATISGNLLTPRAAGTVIVRAAQSGDAAFSPAIADISVVVGVSTQTIAFAPPVSAILVGQPVRLGAVASSGLPITYSVVSGPATLTGDTLVITGTAPVIVRATQPGTAQYAAASVDTTFVADVAASSRLANLSARAAVSDADAAHTLIAGFAITGTGGKRLLLRAVGPALSAYGVTNPLSDPQIQVVDSAQKTIAQNDDWSGTDVAAAGTTSGAFALPAGGHDAALIVTLQPGNYSMVVGAKGGTGVALAEIYDLDDASSSAHLLNLSTRGSVGAGDNGLVTGFVVTGNAPKRVLIRGVGPTLANYGVTGAVSDPALKVYQGATVIAQNDDWETGQPVGATQTAATGAQLRAAATSVGAFALPAGSHDAAVVLTLPPGAYTAIMSGQNGATGAGLIEVYELP